MLTEQRGRLDDDEGLPPGEAAREEDQRKPERVRRAPRFHLPLPVQGQLFPEEQILGGQGRPSPEAGAEKPHEVQAERGHYPT